MKKHIAEELPQRKFKPAAAESQERRGENGKSSDPQDKVRQAVYDIRYRARREEIPLQSAFSQYMSNSSMGQEERSLVRAKLFGESYDIESFANSNLANALYSVFVEGATPEYIEEDQIINSKGERKYKIEVVGKDGRSYVRYATREKINDLRLNPNIKSVEMTDKGEPYEGEKSKGEYTAKAKAGKDWDGDRKVESSSKEHAGVVHNAIQRKSGGIPDGQDTRKESVEFIGEVKEGESSDKPIDVMSKKKKNNCKVFPELGKDGRDSVMSSYIPSGTIIGESDLSQSQNIFANRLYEEVIVESAYAAAEYFINEGLNEYGVDILIEELGLDEFVDYVYDLGEDNILNEARRSGRIEPVTKTGKSVGSLKGGPRTSAIKRLRKEKAARRESEVKASEAKPSGLTAALKRQSAIASAKKEQPKTKKSSTPTGKKKFLDTVAGHILSGIERHQKATKATKETLGKLSSGLAKGTTAFAGGVVSGAKGTVDVAKKTKKAVVGEGIELEERSLSKSETKDKEKYVKGMKKSEKGFKDRYGDSAKEVMYATATKMAKNGEKKCGGSEEDDDRDEYAKRNLLKNKIRAALGVKNPLLISASYEMDEDESVELSELNRYEKETGKDYKTGKPVTPGGTAKNDKVMSGLLKKWRGEGMMGASGDTIPKRGKKKERGKKPPVAGAPGGPESPEQKVNKRREIRKQGMKDMMNTRGT